MAGVSWRFVVVAGISGVVAWLSYKRKCGGRRPVTPEQPLINQRVDETPTPSTPEEVQAYLRSVQKKDLHKLETLFAISRSADISDSLQKQVLRKISDVLGSASAKPSCVAELVKHTLTLVVTRPEISVEAADVLVEACRDKLRPGVEISDIASAEIAALLVDKKLPASLIQRLLRAVFYLSASKENAKRFPLHAVLEAVATHRHSQGVLIDGLNALPNLISNGPEDLVISKAFDDVITITNTSDNAEVIWRGLAVVTAIHDRNSASFHAQATQVDIPGLCFEILATHGVKHRQVAERTLHLLVTLGIKTADDSKKILIQKAVAAHGKTVPVLVFYANQINQ